MEKILIAVPTFENILPDTFKSIYGLKKPDGFAVMFDFVRGYHCARARNLIAEEAIKYGFDYVLMVDSDMVIPQNTLTSMLDRSEERILTMAPLSCSSLDRRILSITLPLMNSIRQGARLMSRAAASAAHLFVWRP